MHTLHRPPDVRDDLAPNWFRSRDLVSRRGLEDAKQLADQLDAERTGTRTPRATNPMGDGPGLVDWYGFRVAVALADVDDLLAGIANTFCPSADDLTIPMR